MPFLSCPQYGLCLSLAIGLSSIAIGKPSIVEFEEFYELDPISIVGEEIPITVFARSSGDRRYATRFAHNVVEVAYDTLQGSPGPGLIVIGRSGEPHPITLLESFMEKARRQGASPELAQIADELEKSTANWRAKIELDLGNDDKEEEEDFPIDERKLIDAFPIPLPHVAAQLYLLAWEENFHPERVAIRLSQLKEGDLNKQDFEAFRWIFYLPPQDSLNKAIKEVLPAAFEKAEIGPFKRMVVRVAIATFKPLIKDAVEGLRKGVLYWSVLSANEAKFSEGDIKALTDTYIRSQLPRGKITGTDKKKRALEATRAQSITNAEHARDPFQAPEPSSDFAPETFEPLLGRYSVDKGQIKRFFLKDGTYYWQGGKKEPIAFLPAGGLGFVSADRNLTLQFIPGETPNSPQVEIRKVRFRKTFGRLLDVGENKP